MTFVLTTGGHNAGIVSPPGASRRRYQVRRKLDNELYVDPDSWASETPTHAGSWWPEWAKWQSKFSDGKVPARQPGGDKLKPIEEAPGAYVKVRAV